MRSITSIVSLAFAVMAGTVVADTIHYPSKANALFTLEVPDDWEQSKEKDDNGVFSYSFTGPTGAFLFIKATDVKSKNDVEEAIANSVADTRAGLKENYKEYEYQNPVPDKDNPDIYAGTGGGINKEDGKPYGIANVFIPFGKDKLVEIYTESQVDDKKGADQATEIIKSVKPVTPATP